MERRKIIIYAIFAVTLAYGIYFHFLSGDSKAEYQPDVNPSAPARAAFVMPDTGGPLIRDDENPKDIRPVRNNDRPRNPFLRESKGKASSFHAGKPVQYAKPTISAISPGGPETFVVANNRILKIGESTGVWTLVKAENGQALFSGPNGSIWIKIGG
jgi:hypothetical protein